jgi:hypothetical protein
LLHSKVLEEYFLQLEDEDALREEEEEALALQRESARGLRNEDFGAGSSSSGEEAEEDNATNTLGHAASQVSIWIGESCYSLDTDGLRRWQLVLSTS